MFKKILNFWKNIFLGQSLTKELTQQYLVVLFSAMKEMNYLSINELKEINSFIDKLEKENPQKAYKFITFLTNYIKKFISLSQQRNFHPFFDYVYFKLACQSMGLWLKKFLENKTFEKKYFFLKEKKVL